MNSPGAVDAGTGSSSSTAQQLAASLGAEVAGLTEENLGQLGGERNPARQEPDGTEDDLDETKSCISVATSKSTQSGVNRRRRDKRKTRTVGTLATEQENRRRGAQRKDLEAQCAAG